MARLFEGWSGTGRQRLSRVLGDDMITYKYDGRMEERPAWLISDADAAQVDFDLERLNPQSLGERLANFGIGVAMPLLLWVGRKFSPVVRIGQLSLITQHKQVQWALANPDKFAVHFNPEVRRFAGGASTFMLALDGEEHSCQRKRISGWFTDKNYDEYVEMTTSLASKLLDASGGHIDVVKDYFTRVSSEVGIAFLGIGADDPDAFADWTIAMSNANFADFQGQAVARELASHGAWRERGVVDRAITLARSNSDNAYGLLGYLIQPDVLGDDDDLIRSVLFGVSVALAPTITIAAGNMMAYLQSDPDAMKQCVAAAKANDRRARLEALLLEVGRLRPALSPGQFRYAPADVNVPGGIFGSQRIKAGDTVLVCTASALRDGRVFSRPDQFIPDRETGPEMSKLMFGHKSHYCLGDELAVRMLVRLFETLLSQPEIDFVKGKEGKLHRVGPFPRQQYMDFSLPGRPRNQAEIICHLPVETTLPSEIEKLRTAVRALENPVRPDLREALDRCGILHFLSMTLIADPVPDGRTHSLILELRADGDDSQAVSALVSAIGKELVPIVAQAGFGGDASQLADFLVAKRLSITLWPWGATGLHYNGSSEFSVWSKHRQAKLSNFAGKAVDFYVRWTSGRSTRPITAIHFVRSLINGTFDQFRHLDDFRALTACELEDLARMREDGSEFADMLSVPSRQRLRFTDWRDKADWDKGSDYLASKFAMPAWIAVGLALLLAGGLAAVTVIVAPEWSTELSLAKGTNAGASLALDVISIIGGVLLATVTAFGVLALTIGLATFLFIRTLRRHELADRPDTRDPDPENLRKIAARENQPGYQQNHIIAISDTKAGWFRRLTMTIAMWGIGVLVTHWFRPGFIATMGTIHFASWVRLPKSGKLVFVSNYDGSWDSYLEDFITKVPSGQTAAWTHATGFPRTRMLIGDGVRDADAFKRWVRRQQRPTDVWYSRLEDLTLDRVRTNALIHDGLARAQSDTAARQWLANFGSAPATDTLLETNEIQTIVFRGLPGRSRGAILLLQLPESDANRQDFLRALLQGSAAQGFPTINFGEMPPGGNDYGSVASLALSARGLIHCGLDGGQQYGDIPSFPFAFTEGMKSRARIIGDAEGGASLAWDDRSANNGEVHAVLQILTKDENDRHDQVTAFTQWLVGIGGRVLETINTDPASKDKPYRDHFGFRDGLSQPAIRGSFNEKRALPRDLMEPGEFIFGYRGNQGNFAMSPRVPIADDPLDILPDVTVEPASRFPAARKLQQLSPPFRDFGRNGSFLVIRQLRQHVVAFEEFTGSQATQLSANYPGLAANAGTEITKEWVAAKMMGRWHDGVPLTARVSEKWPEMPDDVRPLGSLREESRNPERDSCPARSDGDRPTDAPFKEPKISQRDSDFALGAADPRGLACPLGSHVRRVNPRDSLLPEDPEGLIVSNRHRILRRGRSYTRTTADGTEKGLMFIGVCSDLERQFEFLQQRWIGGRNFHGLDGETDPIASTHGTSGKFTIPTVAGPVRLTGIPSFVEARGGGYFFLPSRSALRYLETLSRRDATAAATNTCRNEQ